jgi:hypothetical protein
MKGNQMDISVVMGSTNRNYGGEVYREVEPAVPTPFKDRIERCIYTISDAFKDLDYEILYVQWNPDPDRENIGDWDFIAGYPRLRLITVPTDFAQRVCPENEFHETHAKNIGIRRAQSDLILCTNPDIMWLDPFPRSIIQDMHREERIMVAKRMSVYHPVLDCGLDIEKIREFCTDPANLLDPDLNANGDFTLMPKSLWYKLQGLPTPPGNEIAGVDMWQVIRAEQITGKARRMYPHLIYHTRHPGKPQGSSYGTTITSPHFGFPNTYFVEMCDGRVQ